MAIEMLKNGDFEDGLNYWTDDFPDNFGYADAGLWSESTFVHSGAKSVSAAFPRKYLAQDFDFRFTINRITYFRFWQYHTGPVTRLYLVFQDTTFVYWNVCGGGGVGCGLNTWNELDGTIVTWAGQPVGTFEDKIIVKIVLVCHWIAAGAVYMDDMSILANPLADENITIVNAGGSLCCDAIAWRESQIDKVAVRNIPLCSTGSFIDTGTYTLKNRKLEITFRLTAAQKTTLQAIFNQSEVVTITAIQGTTGTWTYTAWLRKKPIIYEYSKNGDGTVREWLAELEFDVSAFSYAPT